MQTDHDRKKQVVIMAFVFCLITLWHSSADTVVKAINVINGKQHFGDPVVRKPLDRFSISF